MTTLTFVVNLGSPSFSGEGRLMLRGYSRSDFDHVERRELRDEGKVLDRLDLLQVSER